MVNSASVMKAWLCSCPGGLIVNALVTKSLRDTYLGTVPRRGGDQCTETGCFGLEGTSKPTEFPPATGWAHSLTPNWPRAPPEAWLQAAGTPLLPYNLCTPFSPSPFSRCLGGRQFFFQHRRRTGSCWTQTCLQKLFPCPEARQRHENTFPRMPSSLFPHSRRG